MILSPTLNLHCPQFWMSGFVQLNILIVLYSLFPQTRRCTCCFASSTSWWGWPAPPPSSRSSGQLGWMQLSKTELRQQVAESSRKMQELRAQIQVKFSAAVISELLYMKLSIYCSSFFAVLIIHHLPPPQAQLKLADHLRKMAEHGGGTYSYLHAHHFLYNSLLTYWQIYPDLDEASRAELDAIQGNLAKLKGRKGLDDLDVDEWVDKNKRVKAVTIIFYETSLWDNQ